MSMRSRNKLCASCQQHRAVFFCHGEIRFRRDHDLCPRCWKAAIDRLRAMLLQEVRR